jgi:hypothetical protein
MRRFDAHRKGKLAVVEHEGLRCAGRGSDVWSVACSPPIARKTGRAVVHLMLTKTSGAYTSFGVVKPSADLDERVGFQIGGACVDTDGSTWLNEKRQTVATGGYQAGDPLLMVVDTDLEGPLTLAVFIRHREVYRCEVSEGSRFAVGGLGEQHAYKIDVDAEEMAALRAENAALKAELEEVKAQLAESDVDAMRTLKEQNGALRAEVEALTSELMTTLRT